MHDYKVGVYRKRVITEFQEIIVAAPDDREAHQVAVEITKTKPSSAWRTVRVDGEEFETAILNKGIRYDGT